MTSDGIPLLAITVPLAAIAGLLIGSFLNVVVYRTPRGLSVSTPRSFCPTCQRQLEWWENVPVLSWLALRGRCHSGNEPISIRYPLVELSTGTAFALITWGWHGTIQSAAYCLLAAGMIAVSLIEYGGMRAPLAVAGIPTALGLAIIVAGAGWQGHWAVVGGAVAGSVIGMAIIAVLRSIDPDCRDPRGHGRSALLLAGCWTGGLGLRPTAVGGVVWIVGYLLAMVAAWSVAQERVALGPGRSSGQTSEAFFGAPLVTALALSMVASLMARG
jgi:leader peptidase (prepilin peptidase)/N-methyltransferase